MAPPPLKNPSGEAGPPAGDSAAGNVRADDPVREATADKADPADFADDTRVEASATAASEAADKEVAGESRGSPDGVDAGEADAEAADPDELDLDDDELEELHDAIDPEDLDEFEALVEQGADGGAPEAAAADATVVAGEIPMLTEVVQVPRYDTEDLPQSLAEVNWGDLGQRVRENVLERLLRRSDALLDTQLQNTLAPVLERAAEAVAQELHDALNRMIRDIVARAVTEELTRLHAEIAKRNRSTRPS